MFSSIMDDYRLSSDQLASSVHKAIRDGEYQWLEELVGQSAASSRTAGRRGLSTQQQQREQPVATTTAFDILWEPNSSGWTAVHFAAAHFLPMERWDWILVRAACGATESSSSFAAGGGGGGDRSTLFTEKRTALGQSVFDIFLRSYFDPLPWQSAAIKNRSKQLLEALKTVCADDALIQSVHAWLQEQQQHQQHQEYSGNNDNNSSKDSDNSNSNIPSTTNTNTTTTSSPSTTTVQTRSTPMPPRVVVHRVVLFLQSFDSLCRAAAFGHPNSRSRARLDWLRFVCRHMGSYCPAPLAQLLICMHPTATQQWQPQLLLQQTSSTISLSQSSQPISTNTNSYATLCLPLHVWASNTQHLDNGICGKLKEQNENNAANNNTSDVDGAIDPLLLSLLSSYPEAAHLSMKWIDDGEGDDHAEPCATFQSQNQKIIAKHECLRLPLHMALAAGRSWHGGGIQALFQAFPGGVQCIDPVTNLPPVALAAMAGWQYQEEMQQLLQRQSASTEKTKSLDTSWKTNANNNKQKSAVVVVRARQICVGQKGLISIWQMVPKERRETAIRLAERHLDSEHITTIFQLLRAYPRALESCSSSFCCVP